MSDISDKVDTINFPSDAEDTTVTEINSEDNTLFSVLLYSELLGKK
jgi:multidrug efflux pump subunit AcrB